jgi:hypothetical protein
MTWDFLILSLVLFSIMYVPFRIGFDMQDGAALIAFDLFMDGLFFLDIMFTMNTAAIDPKTDKLVVNRRKLVRQYLKLWFWIDIVSSIPFDMLANSLDVKSSSASAFKLVKILRLFRLLKLMRVFKTDRIKERLERLNISPALVNVITLLGILIGAAHVIACFWVFIARGDVLGSDWKTEHSWITYMDLQEEGPLRVYVCALYWTMATILTIGYGDIHAINMGERVYAILVLSGGMMFAAVISQITKVTAARNPTQQLIIASMSELDTYLSQKKFPKPLKKAVRVRLSQSLLYLLLARNI